MSLDVYTQNIGLTQKATFWSNYVSALKGAEDLRAPEEAQTRVCPMFPSCRKTADGPRRERSRAWDRVGNTRSKIHLQLVQSKYTPAESAFKQLI